MAEIFVITLAFAVSRALPYAIVKEDLEGLSPERLSRAWRDTSFLVAVILFGPLALPVHFVKTRRSWAGLGLGLGVAVGAIFCIGLVEAALSWALGVD
ncbi:MAG TPA: hypothetical protein VNW92_12790 [Polyangiaceae bacterium]|jgi:hypothetical protein|nr:hypothetical protein [Polyangiaceae bacterium]